MRPVVIIVIIIIITTLKAVLSALAYTVQRKSYNMVAENKAQVVLNHDNGIIIKARLHYAHICAHCKRPFILFKINQSSAVG